MRFVGLAVTFALCGAFVGCGVSPASETPSATNSAASTASATAPATPLPSRIVHASQAPVVTGEQIALADLSGRIVFDDFDDLFAMDVDGSDVARLAYDAAGPEFDGSWSPDGDWIAYRDSTRGINQDDEVFIVRADGTDRRNLTDDPANDWGPDWSPDGTTIAFNSDRDHEGGLRGYLVNPDGSNLHRIEGDAWIEYPSWSPDGTKLAFMGALGANYELFVVELGSGDVRQLTDSPGHDGWPAWSPDGSTIAFTSVRDDCRFAPPTSECWRTGDVGEHHDVWTIGADGSDLRRVTPEFGQFVAWSPDGRYLLVSGYALYVVRPDGSGRLELRSDRINRPLGGIPDWHAG